MMATVGLLQKTETEMILNTGISLFQRHSTRHQTIYGHQA